MNCLFTSTHDLLIKHLKLLNYAVDETGICYGISFMGMQAIFSGELDVFNSRIDTLAYLDNLEEDLNRVTTTRLIRNKKIRIALQEELEAKLSIKKRQSIIFENLLNEWQRKAYFTELNRRIENADRRLTQRDRDILSTPAFFDGIALHCHPENYPQIFEEKDHFKSQDGVLTLPRVLPKKYTHMALEVEKIDSFDTCGAYDQDEVESYFQILRQRICEQQHPALTEPVTFVLSSSNHTICVGFDPKKKAWILIDANQLPAKTISTNREMAEKVMRAFTGNDTAIFSTELFVKKSENEKILNYCEICKNDPRWKRLHEVTTKKAVIKDSDGHTLLQRAAATNQVLLVAKLLEQKINVDEKAKSGLTALYIAAQQNHPLVVDLLRQKKIAINRQIHTGATALYIAALKGHTDVVDSLLKHPDIIVDTPHLEGATPLMIATQNNHIDIVEKLLEKKADVNACRKGGITSLIVAIERGNAAIVNKLLRCKANVEQAKDNGSKPLHLAALYGQVSILEKLLECKGDINATMKNGETALYVAAKEGQEATVDKLLEYKELDVNKARSNGETPLHSAIKFRQVSIVKKLLDHPEIKLNLTCRLTIAELIHFAEFKHRSAHVRALFAKKNIKEFVELNMLELAVYFGHTEIVSLLLKKGMDTHTDNKISLLDMTEAMAHTEIKKMLNLYPTEEKQADRIINETIHNHIISEIDKYIAEKINDIQSCCFFMFRNTALTEQKLNIARLLKEDILITRDPRDLVKMIEHAKHSYATLGCRHFISSHFETCLGRIENLIKHKEDDKHESNNTISSCFSLL